MGYYTSFELNYELYGPRPDPKKIAKITKLAEEEGIEVILPCTGLEKFEEYCDKDDSCSYGELSQFFHGDNCKWYEYEEDCRRASKENPGVLLTLSGEGEESGDLWKMYFLNGKAQRCNAVVTYEHFDEDKLI